MSGVTDLAEDPDSIAQDEVRSPPWTEERCEELWERIEGVRHKLTRILHPAKLTPYLRQCKVIDEEDEDEVLNSTQYPLRISKAGRLLDILRGQGQRGLQAFMESLEFYHPEQYTQLTGEQATQRCSLILDEEGPEGLTQFLLLEVKKLREQLRNSRLCERRLSQRCRMAEEERSRAERKAQELRHDRLQLERLRQDWESASRELGKLKDRLLEQAVKYSRALEEQGKSTSRERELLRQVEELKSRLSEVDTSSVEAQPMTSSKRNSLVTNGSQPLPPALPEKPLKCLKSDTTSNGTQDSGALMDILQQDRREAAEERQELCDMITTLQEEAQRCEEQTARLEVQCEQLQLKVRTLQLDWETEQKRSVSYFNQIMELEKERDQALRSRDSLQLEFTECLLDKNRLRKRIAELQASIEQQQRELERERAREQMNQSTSCLHCSHLSLWSEDQCYGPCCSLGLSPQSNNNLLLRKSQAHLRERIKASSSDSHSTSEENLLISAEDNEKEINRLSTFPFPPCMNSINRRVNAEFDLDSWGSDENENIAGQQSELSLWDSWTSLHSQPFPSDLIKCPSPKLTGQNISRIPQLTPPSSTPPSPKDRKASLADDITIVGGNQTGIFVSHVKPGSPAEQCGLTQGCELLELERVLFGGGSVQLAQCTAEIAHFSLQWWTEPSSLKHQNNPEAYAKLCSQMKSSSFMGADSFYVRVNLTMEPHGDPPSLGVSCDDIIHVTDTRFNGKYHWRCWRVDPNTAKPLQAGTMPNYNRAQQLLLVRLRKLALEQKDFKRKMFLKKAAGRVRLIKAVDPSFRGIGSGQQVFYTLSKRHEEHLIPYSLVKPLQVETKRPVVFSPSLLSRGLIERLMQPADASLNFSTCPTEHIPSSKQGDKQVFLLDSYTPEQTLGVRLQSIQDIISQDKHCLLELGLSNVEGLLRQGIYPIVIYIRPKSKKHKKLRKFFPRCVEDGAMEEACHAEELQLETLPLLYYTLEPNTWSCTEELLSSLRNVIQSQQRAVAWVELDRLQ
ncbi:caspase recruitment domain-containing protein 10 isoform X2 [Boleophthalmus pectinirostris]|uniref:caspase recruitment domain-containing protein 10 isoform X2 n=1 Tax=Boleophthalmus pectinirostris TaxID=150288 RepID=UPI00242F5D0C|nr:caspase recruitment domain-containing protein 10 isoform X2 [Boleophthalmus pectinirostris]